MGGALRENRVILMGIEVLRGRKAFASAGGPGRNHGAAEEGRSESEETQGKDGVVDLGVVPVTEASRGRGRSHSYLVGRGRKEERQASGRS